MLKIVTFGDSTTAPRDLVKTYSDLIQADLASLGLAISVSNAGRGGDTTEDGRLRLAQDVLVLRPDIVVIQFGINDSTVEVWRDPAASVPPVSTSQFAANLEFFVDAVRAVNSAPILMTPNPMRWTPAMKSLYGKAPYRPHRVDGFSVTLRPYADIVRHVAIQRDVPLVDVYAAFEHYGINKSMDDLLLDGMHPNNDGHRLVADLLVNEILKIVESRRVV